MYKNKHISATLLLFLLAVISCNPTKDKWLNRKYHTLTGHYNVYFNGEQKLLDAILQMENAHQNNFGKVLEVFPLGSSESAKAAGNILDEAIKKFSKAIQMHTIGAYTDDSYVAMGKCRFYKQDYFASIETFQYIIGKYKNGPFTNLSTCYIARNYVGLKKLGEAESIMGLLLAKKNFEKKDIAMIYATAADINIKQEKYTSAIENLKVAITGKLKKEDKIRYYFILGQLCLQANKKAEASFYFNKVISMVPSYDFAFNANINLTKIYDINDPRSVERVKRNLKRMASDEKNIDFLDQIFYELGKINLAQKNYTNALSDFKKSSSFNSKNKTQKALTLFELAKLYFEIKEFKNAQIYYDSTVNAWDDKDSKYSQIKETKTVLSDLISNLQVYEVEDSLQKLAILSKDALERKIDFWIAENKRQAELAEKEAKKRAKQNASLSSNQNAFAAAAPSLPGSGDNSWYFYNATLLNAGIAEFFSNKKWGQRANEDYWRIAAKEKPKQEIEPDAKDTSELKNKNTAQVGPKEIDSEQITNKLTGDQNKDKWVKDVPLSIAQKKRSNERMLLSLNNLGNIYFDRLKSPIESKKYYDILQNRFPESEYEPNAFYYLYKSNLALKNNGVAEENKNQLIQKYPDNPYSLMLQNKVLASAEISNNSALNQAYEKMFSAYQQADYWQAISMKGDIEKQFPGNPLAPKIDLLHAFCIGKTQSKEAFLKALTEVSNAHKGLDVAAKADEFIKVLTRAEKVTQTPGANSGETAQEFDLETETPFYFVFAFKEKVQDLNEILSAFNSFNEAYASDQNLKVNPIMSNEGFQLITIREFKNFTTTLEYMKTIQATQFKSKKLKLTEPIIEYAISTKNFKVVLKDKKIEKFEAFFKNQLSANQHVK